MSELSFDDKVRLFDAISRRSDTKAFLAFQWVQHLERVTRSVCTHRFETPSDTLAGFWIRLHGLLIELGAHYDYMGTLIGFQPCRADNRQALIVRDSIRTLRNALDADEAIYLHYRRDSLCHVWQESYDLSAKNGKIKERRHFTLLEALTFDEFDRRVRAFLVKHRNDETGITVMLAERVAPLIESTLAAMVRLYER